MITCPKCHNDYSANYEVCPMCRHYRTTLRQRADYMVENAKDHVSHESCRNSFVYFLVSAGYSKTEAEQIVHTASHALAADIRKAGLSRIMLALLIGFLGVFVGFAGFCVGHFGIAYGGLSIVASALLPGISGLRTWIAGKE